MKTMFLPITLCGMLFILFVGCVVIYFKEEKSTYRLGYESGYKDAKIIYECDHDRSECEIIKDSIDAN